MHGSNAVDFQRICEGREASVHAFDCSHHVLKYNEIN
jgi:hypothetical protein